MDGHDLVTTDGGATWTRQSTGTANGLYARELRSVPGNQGHLFATNGYQTSASHPFANSFFYRSRDGGATWTAISNMMEVNSLGFGAAAPGASYPTLFVAGFYNSVYGIWASTDEGATWTKIISDAFTSWPLTNDMVQSMDGDKDVLGRCYVGFQGTGVAYCDLA